MTFPDSVDGPWARYVENPNNRGIGTVHYRRLAPLDAECAKELSKRTLTNLYNQSPAWLANAHRRLDEAVFAFKQHLGEHAMRSLENCALDLPEAADVDPDEIKQIQDAVNALFHEVRESGIKNPLKNWLMDHLSAIKQMIDLYWIKGPRVVREAFAAMVGEAALYGQKFNEVKEEAPNL